MTTATLGDLFPDMRKAAPKQVKKKSPDRKKGTAETLKALYPEIDGWHPVFISKLWLHWRRVNGMDLSEPKDRDERFMDYLAERIHQEMVERGSWR